MSAVLRLDPTTVTVEPGGEAAVRLTVRNTGTVVDQFIVEVVGVSTGWTTAEPATLSLFPNAEGTVVVTFRPPRVSSTPAGSVVFGLLVRSQEDPAGSTVEEGVLDVGGFLATAAELIPRTSRGSRSGRHDIAIDNRGNIPMETALEGIDPDRHVRFDVDPERVSVAGGGATFGRLVVRPARTFWRGPARTVPFQVRIGVEAPDAVPVVLDGTYVQEPVLPWWFTRALVAIAALIVAAILLWLFVLQPQIRSTAVQTLEDYGFSPKPGSAAAGGGSPDGSPGGEATAAPSDALTVTPPPDGGQVLADGRLDTTNAVTPTAGTLFITDLVFSNPTGASGELTLQRTTPSAGTPLLVLRLENFRDLDLHFVTPITLRAGETLSLVASCTGGAADPVPACTPAVFYSGYLKAP